MQTILMLQAKVNDDSGKGNRICDTSLLPVGQPHFEKLHRGALAAWFLTVIATVRSYDCSHIQLSNWIKYSETPQNSMTIASYGWIQCSNKIDKNFVTFDVNQSTSL